MKKSGIVLALFGVFWMAVTGVFDFMLASQVIHQTAAENWPTVEGRIKQSEVKQNSDSDGTTYGVKVRYLYEVDGRSYEGNRYRWNDISTSGSEWASEIVRKLPPGAEVAVRYNPDSPEKAVLVPGLEGVDWMLLLFLTPFNLVGVGVWTVAFIGWYGRSARELPAGGVSVWSERGCTMARLPRWSPILCSAGAAGGIAFVLIFVVGFSCGFRPPELVGQLALLASWGSGLLVYLWQWQCAASGLLDLVIDPGTRSVTLPQTFGRRESVQLSVDAVRGVRVEKLTKNNGDSVTYTYVVRLHVEGLDPAGERLADWSDEEKARQFAAWLGEQLGVPVT